jgi:thiol:disulfide interchange protein
VVAALDRAKKSHKRVLIDLGANWCVDCVVLANFLKLPEMQRFMTAHYELVSVDVGRFDRNQQIPARFGITGRLKGVPTLLIVTPDGKLMNGNDVFATADASSMTPQALADYLAKYAD